MRYKSFFGLGILLLISACAGTSRTTSSQSGLYSEDLSYLRNGFEEIIEKDSVSAESPERPITGVTGDVGLPINKKLSYVLDSINVLNLNNRYVDGFAIQVYSGINRDEAMNVKGELYKRMPEISSEIIYTQPSFKVKVGKYYSKLEAQRDFQAIKRNFPNAILVPERIPLDKF